MPIALKYKPLAFIDVETTGLDPAVHEMIEFAMFTDLGSPIVFKIKPRHIETAHPKALEVNGYNEAEWTDAIPFDIAARQIADRLKDCVIVGHNVRFDVGFITALLKSAGVDARIDYHLVDTVTLAYEHLVPKGLTSLSLKNVCAFIGLTPEPDVHRAEAGASQCRNVYFQLVRAGWWKRMMWGLRKKG